MSHRSIGNSVLAAILAIVIGAFAIDFGLANGGAALCTLGTAWIALLMIALAGRGSE